MRVLLVDAEILVVRSVARALRGQPSTTVDLNVDGEGGTIPPEAPPRLTGRSFRIDTARRRASNGPGPGMTRGNGGEARR